MEGRGCVAAHLRPGMGPVRPELSGDADGRGCAGPRALANRDLRFPNTHEAGLDAGKGIAEDCKADPHTLLFAVVDKHVRRVAEAAGR